MERGPSVIELNHELIQECRADVAERGALQQLRRSDTLRPAAIVADSHLRNLPDHLDAAAADTRDRSALCDVEETRVLGIKIVREIDIRLVSGIYCQLRLDRSKPDADYRYEVLKRQRYGNLAARERDAQTHDMRGAVDQDARRADDI